MNYDLINIMKNDLNMSQFSNETEFSFHCRVLYSGLAHWMKTILLDNFDDNENTHHTVSKHHLTARFDEVLKGFSAFFPEYAHWLYPENYKKQQINPSHFFQERLLRTGEILELDFANHLSLPQYKRLSGEGTEDGTHFCYQGIVLSDRKKLSHEINLPPNSANYFANYLQTASFTDRTTQGDMEYFDSHAKTDTYHNSWKTNIPNEAIFVSRRNGDFGFSQYFIEKNSDGQRKYHCIEDILVDSQNFKRFLFALRKKNNNPLRVKLQEEGESFLLERFTNTFPYPEECIFEKYGWPVNSLDDTKKWRFSAEYLPLVKKCLENLAVEID